MFLIKDVDFKSDNYGIDSYLYNWPMLYILENGKKAYVGQTTNIVNRMSQHKASEKKQIFTRAHFIYSDKFNQSATFDYESRLISLMAADKKFILTNQNAGITGLDYYDKVFYDNEFKTLWENLQQKKLAEKTIEELQQSDMFKYSPYKDLNSEQRKLVTEILHNLRRSLDRKIVIKGMPGSGKSITAIYLFKMLREIPEFKELKIGMIVPPTALRDTYKKVFKSINGLSTKDVLGPGDVAKEKYDILLVDEAHRLKMRKNLSNYTVYDNTCEKLGMKNTVTQLDWILRQTRCAILFYDADQLVFPAGLRIETLIDNDSLDDRILAYYKLAAQMRCKGGTKYLMDIKELLAGDIQHKVVCTNYELKIVDTFEKFENIYREKEEKHGLTRMVAGYAWEWVTKAGRRLKPGQERPKYDIMIEGVKKKWNSQLDGWIHSTNAVDEVGCIHSVQGYDLNYGFVIVGDELKYDKETDSLYADACNYYDTYGKQGVEQGLVDYIKNIYYVLMTRGISGTYLYICNPELKEYMSRYIDVIR